MEVRFEIQSPPFKDLVYRVHLVVSAAHLHALEGWQPHVFHLRFWCVLQRSLGSLALCRKAWYSIWVLCVPLLLMRNLSCALYCAARFCICFSMSLSPSRLSWSLEEPHCKIRCSEGFSVCNLTTWFFNGWWTNQVKVARPTRTSLLDYLSAWSAFQF